MNPHPDSYQKVTDPEHWKIGTWILTVKFEIYRYIFSPYIPVRKGKKLPENNEIIWTTRCEMACSVTLPTHRRKPILTKKN
jgi:hypothetical protein